MVNVSLELRAIPVMVLFTVKSPALPPETTILVIFKMFEDGLPPECVF